MAKPWASELEGRWNKKDLEDIPKKVRKAIQFLFVKTMDEVLDIALPKH